MAEVSAAQGRRSRRWRPRRRPPRRNSTTMLAAIPEPAARAEVPDGADETGNVEHHHFGAKRNYAFTPKQHFELGEALGMMDFETAAKLSGARFVVLKGGLARLERALGQFMLDVHTSEHGYTEVNPPLLVRDEAMFGTAQLPKFADDQFRRSDDDANRESRCLRSSRDQRMQLANNGEDSSKTWQLDRMQDLVERYAEADRRQQVSGSSPPPKSRSPISSANPSSTKPSCRCASPPARRASAPKPAPPGKDTRGMIRQHQFTKVELVSITTPEQSQGRARAHARLRRGSPAPARPALSRRHALHRRHGLRLAEDLRHRGLAAGAGHVSRDFVLLGLRRLPGAAHERALPRQGRQAARSCTRSTARASRSAAR